MPPESRNVAKQLYDEWLPQIVHDNHQTGPFPSRIFIPPFEDPPNPQIQPLTHLGIDPGLCGEVVALAPGRAEARMTALPSMAVDELGLVHGGFVFGLADHAAMLAVNDPNVVLGAASTRFLKPVRVGDVLLARATCTTESGRKRVVAVEVARGDEPVMTGELTCFVLDRHVLADMPRSPTDPP